MARAGLKVTVAGRMTSMVHPRATRQEICRREHARSGRVGFCFCSLGGTWFCCEARLLENM